MTTPSEEWGVSFLPLSPMMEWTGTFGSPRNSDMYLTREEFGEADAGEFVLQLQGIEQEHAAAGVAMRVTSSSMSAGRSIRRWPSRPIQLSQRWSRRAGVAMYTIA